MTHGALLLVEDDERYGRACARSLNRRFEVYWLRSVAESRELLSRDPVPAFRYALVDDRLPDGSGITLLPLIDGLRPRPATAFITAYPSHQRTIAAFDAGHLLFTKPNTPHKLTDLIDLLDDRRAIETVGAEMQTAERNAGCFRLDATGLFTPTHFVPLRGGERRLLNHLLDHATAIVSASDLAAAALGRRDRGGAVLIRRYVANLRRALGAYRWLIETVPSRGYRVAPRACAARNARTS